MINRQPLKAPGYIAEGQVLLSSQTIERVQTSPHHLMQEMPKFELRSHKFVPTRRKKRSRVTQETQQHLELDKAASRHALPSGYIPVKRNEKKKP